jgi:hypothetical protein
MASAVLARMLGKASLAIGVAAVLAHAAQGEPLPPGAGEPAPAPSTAPSTAPLPDSVRALPAVAQARSAGGPLGDTRLEELRGGTETPWSDMRLNGSVGGNSAVHVVTGANSITDGAFSNASGLPMVIQNSGANVLIQNATIVNVQIR